jgi:hypothetical protein
MDQKMIEYLINRAKRNLVDKNACTLVLLFLLLFIYAPNVGFLEYSLIPLSNASTLPVYQRYFSNLFSMPLTRMWVLTVSIKKFYMKTYSTLLNPDILCIEG